MPGGNYFILLILTDGIITDMQQTCEAIVNVSAAAAGICRVRVHLFTAIAPVSPFLNKRLGCGNCIFNMTSFVLSGMLNLNLVSQSVYSLRLFF